VVSETVESVHENGTCKRVSVFVDFMWDFPAGRRLRSVNIRSVGTGEAPSTARAAAQQLSSASGCVEDTDAEKDGGSRHRASAAYRASSLPVLPDSAERLAGATAWTAHGALLEEEDVLEPVGGCGVTGIRKSTSRQPSSFKSLCERKTPLVKDRNTLPFLLAPAAARSPANIYVPKLQGVR
jgi:hypothetical protein